MAWVRVVLDSLPGVSSLFFCDSQPAPYMLISTVLEHKGMRTVFLVHNGFAVLALALSVIGNPLASPLDRLPPKVWVRVESAKVDIFEGQLDVKVTTNGAVVGPVVGLDVVEALTAPGDQVVAVEPLDKRTHLVDPFCDELRRALGAGRQVAHTVGSAARLVCQFPGHDDRRVTVARDEGADVVLEGFLNSG